MANIQPFDYQKSTNIEEHNQIVNKVNEIVQVINDVNLDTINSEIADLKTKATATDTEIANIKNKDTQQDTEIDGIDKSLISNVTATFDNPSRELKISMGKKDSTSIDATVVIPSSSETGQYSAGNGITIENYQIAVDTNVVALKTDIPDVSGINNRLDTIDGEITGINANITNLTNKNTEQDTAINGKVAIAQGTENAGKVLGIGADGNVTPVDAGGSSGGGEVWEEVDLNNWPTDWVNGDRVRINSNYRYVMNNPSSWGNVPTKGNYESNNDYVTEFELEIMEKTYNPYKVITMGTNSNYVSLTMVQNVANPTILNRASPNDIIVQINTVAWNGGGRINHTTNIDQSNKTTTIRKMWRCRASTQSP